MAEFKKVIKEVKSEAKAFQDAIFVMNKIGNIISEDRTNLIINGGYKSGRKNIELEISIIGIDETTSITTITGNSSIDTFMLKYAVELFEKGLKNADNAKYNFKFGVKKKTLKIIIGVFVVVIIIGAFTSKNNESKFNKDESNGTVGIDPWNNVPYVVEDYLKTNYYNYSDAKAYGGVNQREDGTFDVLVSFRADNILGGKTPEQYTFVISKDGKRVISAN